MFRTRQKNHVANPLPDWVGDALRSISNKFIFVRIEWDAKIHTERSFFQTHWSWECSWAWMWVNLKEKFCSKLNEMSRFEQKSHIYQHPILLGVEWIQYKTCFFPRNCIKCSEQDRKKPCLPAVYFMGWGKHWGQFQKKLLCDTLGNSGFQVFQVNVVYYKN